ncbi:MAG: hypothetical protein NVSMB9_06500 [Isosphaeraceae bacterium]
MPTPILSKPSGFAPTSLFYITLGALMTIWSGIWYYYLMEHSSGHTLSHYLCFGFLLTGLILLVIGMAVGPMARWSRQAELPPTGVSPSDPLATTQNVSGRPL